jgi:integrase/recombinase XerD
MTSKVRVQRVLMSSGVESATVVRDGEVVDCVDRFLAHLTAIEKSPNTVRAYAHDLRDFVAFLDAKTTLWESVSLEDIGKFVAWLRLPKAARSGRWSRFPGLMGICQRRR